MIFIIKKKSFAKINLALDLIKKRSDGYHQIDTIMVLIDLFDTLSIEISEKMEFSSNKVFIPSDSKNTIIKAIEILRERYHFKENFKIKLHKNIPVQGGMGGGSSNSALAIKMVNQLLNLQMTQNEMLDVAKQVGADVSFFIINQSARVSGIGEIIEPIDIYDDFYLFIVKPYKGVSTRKAFKNVDFSKLKRTDCDIILKALAEKDYYKLVANVNNSLEESACRLNKDINKVKSELLEFGFDAAVMSGSGSTVFGLTQDQALVDKAVKKFVYLYPFVKKSKIILDGSKHEDIR